VGSNSRANPQTFASKGYSKFEFSSLRHRVFIINNLLLILQPDGDFRPNLWVFVRKGCRGEFSAFFNFPINPFNSLDLNSADPCRVR
jgi:hypothetical protein